MGFLAGIVAPYPHLGAIRVIYRWRRQGSAGGQHTSGESPGKAHARVLAGSLFPGGLLAHNTETVLCLHISPGVLQACFRYLLVGSLFPGGLLAMSKNTMDSVSKKTPDSMAQNPMDITHTG